MSEQWADQGEATEQSQEAGGAPGMPEGARGPAAQAERPQNTGHPVVDAVLGTLTMVEEEPVDAHLPVYEAAHDALRAALDGAGDADVQWNEPGQAEPVEGGNAPASVEQDSVDDGHIDPMAVDHPEGVGWPAPDEVTGAAREEGSAELSETPEGTDSQESTPGVVPSSLGWGDDDLAADDQHTGWPG